MKSFLGLILVAVVLSVASAGHIHGGWNPGYSYSAPIVYSRPVYPSYYSGWSGNGWNSGYNGGWNSGWRGGWW
ncbi:unnamed protein product, partial [Brenthis ino]